MSLKIGAILLSIWSGLNLVVGVAVTAATLMKRNAPALSMVFSDTEIARLDEKVVGVVNAQAALANPCIVAICLLVLAIVWTSLVARMRWSFFALVISLGACCESSTQKNGHPIARWPCGVTVGAALTAW